MATAGDSSVHVRATRAAITAALRALPARGARSAAILRRVGLAALGRIRAAFIAKSRGGTDEAGERWAPLSPKTVAYGRRGRSRAERGRNARPSQALTKRQAGRWWQVYGTWVAIFRKRRGGSKAEAARIAWATVKREGAVTLFDKYSKRQVEILRDTGLLFNSLSPGGGEQVLRTEGAAVVVGTNRRGAAAHHAGVPGRLPQRRLWPEPGKWPAAWWADITDQVRAGLLDIAAGLARDAR